MASSLSAHSPKFQSQLATFEQIAGLPTPVALGPRHRPVPHARLIEAFRNEIARRGYSVERETYALGHKGAALFGVIDLGNPDGVVSNGRGLSLGFRNAVDNSMAIRAVAGAHVFVCDNLALSGDVFAIQRKNTTGLDVLDAVARGFDKFLKHAQAFELEIAQLQAAQIADLIAKRIVFDVFSQGVAPVRLFDDVDQFYFKADYSVAPEVVENRGSLWGLHNAFTRAFRDLTPQRRLSASVALGKVFSGELKLLQG